MVLADVKDNGNIHRKFKWILVGLLSVVLLLILVMMNKEEVPSVYLEPQDSYFEVELVPSSLSKSGLVLTLKNKREDCVYMYGDDWGLNHFVDGTWQEVPPIITGDIGSTAMGYYVLPKEQNEYQVMWEWLYGVLPEGKYQFVKRLECIEYLAVTPQQKELGETLHEVYVYVEFELD